MRERPSPPHSGSDQESILAYLKWSLINNKTAYCSAFLTSLAGTATNIISPLFLTKTIRSLETPNPHSALPWMLAYAASWIAAKAIPMLRDETLVPVGTKLSNRLTHDVMQAFYNSPMEQRASSASAETVHHFGTAYEHIGRSFVDGTFGKMLPALLDMIAGVTLISANSGYIGLIMGGALIAHFTLLAAGAPRVSGAQINYVNSLFEGYEYIIAQLGQYANVHYFGAVKRELNHLSESMLKLDASVNNSILVRNRATFLQAGLISGLSIVGAGLFYLNDPLDENMSLDNFLWMLLYLAQISPAYEKMGEAANKLLADYGTFQQLVSYLNGATKHFSLKPLSISAETASIMFKDVSFKYHTGNAAIDKISFSVPAGKTVVITGPSGAGKSSILNLLQRFYIPESGQIIIAEQDISQVDVETLRAAIAVVPQLPVLQNKSLYENIKYAKPDASAEAISAAAVRAGLGKFIETHGLDFMVGDNGAKLSGGQRQRVAIARAYLRNESPILILDEPTSALDPKTEKSTLIELAHLLESRWSTAIVITHRLTTIKYLKNVHSIIVLDKGKIAEQGTLEDLMEQDGLFASQMRIAQEEETLLAKQEGLTTPEEAPTTRDLNYGDYGAAHSSAAPHISISINTDSDDDESYKAAKKPLLKKDRSCVIF
jgi:ABC-type multidrug transport system fused ATPase/permease subunit